MVSRQLFLIMSVVAMFVVFDRGMAIMQRVRPNEEPEILAIAVQTENSRVCDRLPKSIIMSMASPRVDCYRDYAVTRNALDVCALMRRKKLSNTKGGATECAIKIAIQTRDPSICGRLGEFDPLVARGPSSDEYSRVLNCYKGVAQAMGSFSDHSICAQFQEKDKEFCETAFNQYTKERASNDGASSEQASQATSAAAPSWITVDKESYWHNDAYFVDDSYEFLDIAFHYPAEWNFSCCGDMDHGSAHHICSDESFNAESRWCEKDVHITLLNWGLAGCPSGRWDCGLEDIVPKTAQQKYEDEIRNIRATTGALILPVAHLSGLNLDAFAYAKNDDTRSYLVNTGDGVIDITFTLSDEVDEVFITEFLSRITRDGTE